MGAGQAATSALDRISYTLDWSNPLASTLDEVIKGMENRGFAGKTVREVFG
jgi:hypothetical protein